MTESYGYCTIVILQDVRWLDGFILRKGDRIVAACFRDAYGLYASMDGCRRLTSRQFRMISPLEALARACD